MRDVKATAGSIVAQYNDIMFYRKYFGTADTGATSLFSTQTVPVFTQGRGNVDKNMTTQADVTLQDCDTSLFNQNGIIPNAQSFTIMGIGIDIHLANVQPTTPYEDDTITQINLNAAQIDNPYPTVDYIRSQGVFSLYRNSTEFLEQGNVSHYPSGLYNAGWGSDGSHAAAESGTPAQAGFIIASNGASFRPLTVWHRLEALDQFRGEFKLCRPATLTGTGIAGWIDFMLVGQVDLDRKTTNLVANFGG